MEVNPSSFSSKLKGKAGPLIIMASVAVILGLVAAVGIWQYLTKTQKQVKELAVKRDVVVSSQQLSAGTKLTAEDLAIKQLPAHAVPKDYPESKDILIGRILKNTIEADEVITASKLLQEGSAGGLPVVIPPGMRAISIKVNEVTGVSGFVKPGNYVDVLSILESDEMTISKTILQNVLVLTVGDQIIDPTTVSDPAPKLVSQVTLALSPRNSEKLSLASETGQLYLTLRPHDEKTITSASGVTREEIYGFPSTAAFGDGPELPPSVVADKNSVEVILGSKRTYQFY